MRPLPRSRPTSPLSQWLPSHSPSTNLSAPQRTNKPQHMLATIAGPFWKSHQALALKVVVKGILPGACKMINWACPMISHHGVVHDPGEGSTCWGSHECKTLH